MIDEDVFELDLGTDEEDIGFSSFDHTFIQGECDAGYWANNNDYNCVPCSPGTYYSNETRNCLQCEKGSYQDAEAQTSCRQCPEGQFTEGQGAKNISACKDVCHPGHSSESGVAPCFPCRIGSYQPSVLGTDCISCPVGTTTTHVGSTYVDQCQVVCEAGTFSMTGFAPCSPCPAGSYQHLPQQSRCFPCPGNTTTRHEGTSLASLCSDVDHCETLPCLNDATCVNAGPSYSCLCMAGYTGINCQKEIDECESNPCANGATCHDSLNGFDCLCAQGYSGLRCEYDIDECLTVEPCRYNATCINLDGDYQCRCQDDFTGKDCDVEITPCQPDPCQNGATCSLTQLTPMNSEGPQSVYVPSILQEISARKPEQLARMSHA
ncbi:signal peptide, CUB and EGF-like domain-containing protein 1 [Diadema setosum]|uniref:signal peptide, CUB and EGF-like domain-containing protein 1 n=1 Tax=Diadema setosum TaxID=31175 RepID=UPI003B3B77AA